MECDPDDTVAFGPGTQILEKLFDNGDGTNALWYSADGLASDGTTYLLDSSGNSLDPNINPGNLPFSCFMELKIQFDYKACEAICLSAIPKQSDCITIAQNIVGSSSTTFKDIMDDFAAYLGGNVLNESYENVIKVIDGFLHVTNQRVILERKLHKMELTVGKFQI